MAFEKMIGQERVTGALKKVVAAREFPHAFLIEGAAGMGKKMLAQELAEAIVGGENQFAIQWIKESGTIKIETIRALQREIMLRPSQGIHKVFIICQAENMTVQAQNALLKTLEEPPAYAVLLLLTVNGSSLLPTVTSRCQRLKLSPMKRKEIVSYLQDKRSVPEEQAQMLAALSYGSLGRALRLLEDVDFQRRRSFILELATSFLTPHPLSILDQTSFFQEEKAFVDELLELLTSWYRDLLVYQETQDFQFVMNYDRIEEIRRQSQRLGIKQIRDTLLLIDQTKRNLKSNVNYQLNIEVMLLNIQEGLTW